MKNFVRVLVLTMAVGASVNDASATWGDYDPTFGFLGMAVDSVANHHPGGVAVQSDRKILVIGYKIFAGSKQLPRHFGRAARRKGDIERRKCGTSVPLRLQLF